jgi:hypothetical protein
MQATPSFLGFGENKDREWHSAPSTALQKTSTSDGRIRRKNQAKHAHLSSVTLPPRVVGGMHATTNKQTTRQEQQQQQQQLLSKNERSKIQRPRTYARTYACSVSGYRHHCTVFKGAHKHTHTESDQPFFMLAVYSQNAILKIKSAINPLLVEIFNRHN